MEIKTEPRRRKWLDFHLAPPFQWTLIMLFCGFMLWITIQLAGLIVDGYFSRFQTSECEPNSTTTQTHG